MTTQNASMMYACVVDIHRLHGHTSATRTYIGYRDIHRLHGHTSATWTYIGYTDIHSLHEHKHILVKFLFPMFDPSIVDLN